MWDASPELWRVLCSESELPEFPHLEAKSAMPHTGLTQLPRLRHRVGHQMTRWERGLATRTERAVFNC